MSHRQVLQVLSGLMAAMFVAIISGTVVSTSLPRIIADLGGGQASYTWVVTASLLAMTVSTPIWGKFADLFDRKTLLQLSLLIFVLSSAAAGMSRNPETLIGLRVLQGIGTGGLTALVQIVMADIISPRDRGRYVGVLGAIMSVGTIGGPLLGGVITDSLGWRWNFYVGVPIAAVALVLIQKTLILAPRPKRAVSIDYLGAVLISAGVSALLIWVSLGGSQFAWGSSLSIAMIAGAIAILVAAIWTESRADEPIIPLSIFRNRTIVLAIVGSIAFGVIMFATPLFLSQYMQLARGQSPTISGMATIPMVLGSLVSSIFAGQYITRTGTWKPIMVAGSIATVVGYLLLGTLRYDTSLVLMCVYLATIGLGTGAVSQNLVLVVQNIVPVRQLGVASSAVAFFRSLGGASGVAVLGALLGTRVSTLITDGLERLGVDSSAMSSGTIPDLSELPEPVRLVVEGAYGDGVGQVFMLIVPLAVIAVVAVALLPNVPLGTVSAAEKLAMEEAEAAKAATTKSAPVQGRDADRARPAMARQS
jgi:EmrB/QacA subfamily drug resistance transporter